MTSPAAPTAIGDFPLYGPDTPTYKFFHGQYPGTPAEQFAAFAADNEKLGLSSGDDRTSGSKIDLLSTNDAITAIAARVAFVKHMYSQPIGTFAPDEATVKVNTLHFIANEQGVPPTAQNEWAIQVATSMLLGADLPPRPSLTPASKPESAALAGPAPSPQSAVSGATYIPPITASSAPALAQGIATLAQTAAQAQSPAHHSNAILSALMSLWGHATGLAKVVEPIAIQVGAAAVAAHNPNLAPAINELASSLGGTK